MEYIPAKTVVTNNKNTEWFGARYNMNIYKGCCHGCIYCDSRSECYQVDDFDRVRAKAEALRIIRDDLRSKVRKGVVSTGAMSDPYNPFERELCLTRHALELIDAYEFGAAIATKSSLITRDIDILKQIKNHSPVLCKITVTTTDQALASKIEPRVSTPKERLEAIAALSQEGIFSGVLLMPVLPFLEDSEENIYDLICAAARAGAKFIYPAFGVTLRQNQREYYLNRLERLFPGRELRAKYIEKYGERYECRCINASGLWLFFKKWCDHFGLLYKMPEIVRAYTLGHQEEQLRLF